MSLDQLKSLTIGLNTQKPRTIVIQFHGGIVDRCSGLGAAVDFGPAYVDGNAYPIFPIYNVGYDDSKPGLSGNLGPFIEDPRAQSVGKRTQRMHDELLWRLQNGRGHDVGLEASTTDKEEQFRYAALIDGGLYRGGRMWSYMKWVVDQSLLIDTGLHAPTPPPIPATPSAKDPAGRAIAAVVHNYILSQNVPIRVVLVGHSTGSIYIAKFIEAWIRDFAADDQTHPQTSFDIIYVAPAVRYDDFLTMLTTAKQRIAHLRIFTMRDKLERDTPELGSWFSSNIYKPSLLYAISGVFEAIPDTPIVGMQRFWCVEDKTFNDYGAKNGYAGYDWLPNQPHPDAETIAFTKWYLKYSLGIEFPFAFSRETSKYVPETYRTTSVFHGSFPDDPFTHQSIVELATNPKSWDISEAQRAQLSTDEACDKDK